MQGGERTLPWLCHGKNVWFLGEVSFHLDISPKFCDAFCSSGPGVGELELPRAGAWELLDPPCPQDGLVGSQNPHPPGIPWPKAAARSQKRDPKQIWYQNKTPQGLRWELQPVLGEIMEEKRCGFSWLGKEALDIWE